MIVTFLVAFVGFSEGAVVGTAVIAFLTLLDIVPRLAQLTKTEGYIKVYEMTIAVTATLISLASFCHFEMTLGRASTIFIGFFMGVFVGLLASALTEVTNVIPVVVNRFRLNNYIKYIFWALASGKVIGSLIYWLKINE